MPERDAARHLGADTTDRELVFTRTFDAPRALVFKMWTDPRHVAQWWGPRGFSTTVHEMDVRPGGIWRLTMRGPDGRDYRNKIVFLEVTEPARLVYRHAPEPGTEPVTFEVTVTFAERHGKTELTMRMLFPSAAARDHVVKTYGAVEGANQTLGRLEAYLAAFAAGAGAAAYPATPELSMERVLDAPRNLVFDAWSTPQHLAHWWGPKGFTLPSCTVEFHAGGAFRFVFRGPDGTDYPFVGKYLEVARPERIVFKGVIHNTPGQEVLTTVTFEEHRGKTTLRVHQTYSFESDATRGAREGWTQTLDRLAEYLAGA